MPFKDEQKAAEDREKDKRVMVRIAENVLGELLNNPPSWNDPSLSNVRSMVRRIGMDSATYPLSLGDVEEASNDSPPPSNINLSKGIGTSLYKREDMDMKDITLQITHCQDENVNAKLGGSVESNQTSDIPYRQWKLNAIDGDGTVITVRLDSTLNSEGKLLAAGAVIRVASAFAVYMNYGEMYDERCAIVLRDFVILCTRPVPSERSGPHTKRLKVENKTDEENNNDSSNNANDETESPSMKCNNTCSGQLCSKHGLNFSVCLAKCVPIEGISLARVAKECVFVTKEFKDMTNKNKRFLLYYYYATSVYQFHGAGNRIELPECIVSRVRQAYPDDKK